MSRKITRSPSVLKRQKPQGRLRKRYSLRIFVLIASFLGVTTITAMFFSRFSSFHPTDLKFSALNNPKTPKPNWRIDLKNEGSDAFDEGLTSQVLSTLQRELQASPSPDLDLLSQTVQKIGSFSTVRLAQVGPRSIVIQMVPRAPRLCIDADQLRFIGADGSIYGSPTGLDQCPGPVLKGVFSYGRKYQLNGDATISLSKDEASLIRDSINLLDSLTSVGMKTSTMSYARYRGFSVTIQGQTPEISLGYPPYKLRLSKLSSLLDNLKSKGQEALRIELDYQGKAFVKFKKI